MIQSHQFYSRLKTVAILTGTGLALFATNAYASDMGAKPNTLTAKTTVTANTAVLASGSDLVRVEGPDGRIYYNHVIDTDDLRDVELNAETVDTITVEYEGRVYTNRIVKPTT